MRTFLLVSILFLCSFEGITQKTTAHESQIWLGYFNQVRFSDKWGLWSDFHLRTKKDFFTNFSTGIVRLGLTYYLNNDTKLTAGYAFINHFPAEGHQNISQPEHRPWQQIQWHGHYPNIRMMQWVRLEERFRRKILNNDELADGYNYNSRIRYNFFLQIPLNKKKFTPGGFSFVVNDEVHLNFGDEIVYNTFDQNRFFAGFQYQLAKTTAVQFGYMNQFIQTAAGNAYRSNHVARVFLLQNLDLRKK